jgi:TorA maturation chaperone TorD
MSGELDTGVTSSLREFDSIVGFEGPWNFDIIPDHLGNELWAMGQILRKSLKLPSDNDVADDLACQFFNGHLNWTGEFLDAVIDREFNRFYGTVASVTQQFLRDEATHLELPAQQELLQSRNV